tara:strand:- start:281 stop:469 length:189 start_codon:yes stop_codon:yes gene_type:complete
MSIPWVLTVLVGGALYFSFYFKGINFSIFYNAINIVRGKYDASEKLARKEHTSKENGEVSHF